MVQDNWEELKKNIIRETDSKDNPDIKEKISSLQDVWVVVDEKDKNILSDIITGNKNK